MSEKTLPRSLLDNAFLNHFSGSKYIAIIYDRKGRPLHAFHRENHQQQGFLDQLMSRPVQAWYDLPGKSLDSVLFPREVPAASRSFRSRNILELEHLLPDFLVDRPLTSISLLGLPDNLFLGIVSFPAFLHRLYVSNDKPLILADGRDRIFGLNGALVHALGIRDPGAMIGKTVTEIFRFNRAPCPPAEPGRIPHAKAVDWKPGAPFPGRLEQGAGSLRKSPAGLCWDNLESGRPAFLALDAKLDPDASDFALSLDFVPAAAGVPSFILRGRNKRPFSFPDLLGYILTWPRNEKFQFKRGAEKARLMETPAPPAGAAARIEICKQGRLFSFYLNGVKEGSFLESAPFLCPSDHRIYLFLHAGQAMTLTGMTLESWETARNPLPPLTARYAAGGRTLSFNVSLRQETLDNSECNRYQLDDITVLQESIDALTTERDALAGLLAPDHGLIGNSEAILGVRKEISRVARTPLSVLIEGRTGTGKEVLARALHAQSGRRDRPFLKVDCSTIPENLMESELFGHEKGAFTGAMAPHAGRFEQAQGGTLFLDEIANLSLPVQAKLLNVLQDRVIQRVGGARSVPLDIRVVSSSNIPVRRLIEEGRFRMDLYYRLAEFTFTLPPLSGRAEDIPLLARHFISEAAKTHGRATQGLSAGALEALLNHSWPGNVRELRNTVFKAVLLSDAGVLQKEDIRFEAVPVSPASSRPGSSLFRKISPESASETVRECGGNLSRAARKLGVSRVTLYKKLRITKETPQR